MNVLRTSTEDSISSGMAFEASSTHSILVTTMTPNTTENVTVKPSPIYDEHFCKWILYEEISDSRLVLENCGLTSFFLH